MAEHVNGLIIDRQDGVVVVTMDRPKQLHALSTHMRDEIPGTASCFMRNCGTKKLWITSFDEM